MTRAASEGLVIGGLYYSRWHHPPEDNRDPDRTSYRYFWTFCPDGAIASAPVIAEPDRITSWFTCENTTIRNGTLTWQAGRFLAQMRYAGGDMNWHLEILASGALHLTPQDRADAPLPLHLDLFTP
ncbi:MAG: hypothetical protein MRY64_01030 [Hyphomonadaceae bacterium]|nr:hypothetical protein [Hyphomonadaceae bacterium]